MSRRSQPYRKTPQRQASVVLDAMRRGRTMHGHNPMDLRRQMQKRRRRYTSRMSVRASTLRGRNG